MQSKGHFHCLITRADLTHNGDPSKHVVGFVALLKNMYFHISAYFNDGTVERGLQSSTFLFVYFPSLNQKFFLVQIGNDFALRMVCLQKQIILKETTDVCHFDGSDYWNALPGVFEYYCPVDPYL